MAHPPHGTDGGGVPSTAMIFGPVSKVAYPGNLGKSERIEGPAQNTSNGKTGTRGTG